MRKCISSSELDRVDMAAAYLLGLAFFFNDGDKPCRLLKTVQELGYSRPEVLQATNLLLSAGVISATTYGCFKRKPDIKLSEYSKVAPAGRIFEDLNRAKDSAHGRTQMEEKALEVAAEFAVTAVAML